MPENISGSKRNARATELTASALAALPENISGSKRNARATELTASALAAIRKKNAYRFGLRAK